MALTVTSKTFVEGRWVYIIDNDGETFTLRLLGEETDEVATGCVQRYIDARDAKAQAIADLEGVERDMLALQAQKEELQAKIAILNLATGVVPLAEIVLP